MYYVVIFNYDHRNPAPIDVDALKAKFPTLRPLYAKVCAFNIIFDYGITPTTSKLYQLPGPQGSMGVPIKALQDFWIALPEQGKGRCGPPRTTRRVARDGGPGRGLPLGPRPPLTSG